MKIFLNKLSESWIVDRLSQGGSLIIKKQQQITYPGPI